MAAVCRLAYIQNDLASEADAGAGLAAHAGRLGAHAVWGVDYFNISEDEDAAEIDLADLASVGGRSVRETSVQLMSPLGPCEILRGLH